MNIADIVQWCGYQSTFDMLKDNMSTEELLNLLDDFISEAIDIDCLDDYIIDIARNQFNWVDHEGAKADADEMAYQTYKDGD